MFNIIQLIFTYNSERSDECIDFTMMCVFFFFFVSVYSITNSERSEECIDFTMMCVFFFFFVSVYSITSRNNAPISNYGGGFRCKSEYPWCIIEVKKKQIKNDGKTGIFTQNQFSTKSNFFYGCNSKTNH
ncbi:Uncharacterized protein FWK35_00014833 [Aphis craccivora]|uniref:Uncharacterized protein n=1 Tax=Aphis craccivora TaxID=307492 RepID=A0A6G0ZHN8_APHCR|nr:Uncharacterized protein FWK35_00014833 [Aphis craccivora]